MLQLNYDCLESIFKLVDLQQQFMLRRTSQHLTPVIDGLWSRRFKKIDLNDYNSETVFLRWAEESHYIDFMGAISENLLELRIPQRIKNPEECWDDEQPQPPPPPFIERLCCLSGETFTNCKVLTCNLDDMPHVIDFAKIFPNLRRLEVYCENMQQGGALLNSIRTITNCHMIEELYMNGQLLNPIIDEILLKLPRLRKLVALQNTTPVNVMEFVNRIANSAVGRRIHTIATNVSAEVTTSVENLINCVSKLPNIQRFKMYGNEECYGQILRSGDVEASFSQKCIDFGAFVKDSDTMDQFLESDYKIGRSEERHYGSVQFWKREDTHVTAVYVKWN